MTDYLPRPWPALIGVLALLCAAPATAQDTSPATAQETGPATVQETGDTMAGSLSTLCSALPAATTTGIATPRDDIARLLEIRTGVTASRSVRRHSEARWPRTCAPSVQEPPRQGLLPWQVTLRPVYSDNTFRTAYPDDRNNGALWEGRGLSSRLQAGVQVEVGAVSAAFVPSLLFQQNRGYDFPRRIREGYSQYIYRHYTTHIDLPHRFGPDAFSSVEWGQSYIRADAYGMAVGFSTENLWWGPAARYPILMSNTAPGMPHLFLGTSGPLDVWFGWLDAELVWARSTESDYFDEIPENDRHMMGGLSLAFSPRPLPGLWLGAARVYHYADDNWGDVGELLATTGLVGSEQGGNEIASVFLRWAFPEAGAEVYGEWAREDRFYDLPELIQEPDHSQAYMIGFQKLTPVDDRFGIRVQGELVALQELPELRTGSRPLPVFYMHDKISQGHTNRGQVLGAGIGPGGDAQFIGVDVVADQGLAGLYVERVRRATFAAPALELRRQWPYEHDAELTWGARSTFLSGFLSGTLSVSGDLAYTYRYNRDFRHDDVNWTLGLEAAWVPGADLRFP